MKSKLRYMFIVSWIHRQTRRKDPYVYVDNAASKKKKKTLSVHAVAAVDVWPTQASANHSS